MFPTTYLNREHHGQYESFVILSTDIYSNNLYLSSEENGPKIDSETICNSLRKEYSDFAEVSVFDYGENVIGLRIATDKALESGLMARAEEFRKVLSDVNRTSFRVSYSSKVFRLALPAGKITFQRVGNRSIGIIIYPLVEFVLTSAGSSFRRNVSSECVFLPVSTTEDPHNDMESLENLLRIPFSTASFILEDSPLLVFSKILAKKNFFGMQEFSSNINVQWLLDLCSSVTKNLFRNAQSIVTSRDVFRLLKVNLPDETAPSGSSDKHKTSTITPKKIDVQAEAIVSKIMKACNMYENIAELSGEADPLSQYRVSPQKLSANRGQYFYIHQGRTLVETDGALPATVEEIISAPFTIDRFRSYLRSLFHPMVMLVNISILSSILRYYFDSIKNKRVKDIGTFEDELVLDYDEYYDLVLENSSYRNLISKIRELSFLDRDFTKLRDRIKTLKENDNKRRDTALSKSLSILTIAVVLVSFLDTMMLLLPNSDRFAVVIVLVGFISYICYYVLFGNRA